MESLVRELQRDAMDPDVPLSSVLRKALVVAAKLDVPELRTLCEHELGGYGESQAPEYRKIEGQVKVHNPYHGWQPVLIANPDYARRVSERYVNQSIGELEDLLVPGATYRSPSFDTAVSLKTELHRDSNHRWTPNDVHDIDALGSTLAYCDVVVTDKAIAAAAQRAGLPDRLGTTVISSLEDLAPCL